jgi:hypothetical protein
MFTEAAIAEDDKVVEEDEDEVEDDEEDAESVPAAAASPVVLASIGAAAREIASGRLTAARGIATYVPPYVRRETFWIITLALRPESAGGAV